MNSFFHICTTRGKENKEITFFYCTMATLGWDLDWWQWMECYWFLNHAAKFGRVLVIYEDHTNY